MKYKTLSSVIKEVVAGKTMPNVYTNLDTAVRAVMAGSSKKLERHSKDQVYAGTYRTKNFEMSPDAQIYFSTFPKTVDANYVEKSAMLHDKLYTLMRKIQASGSADENDVKDAEQIKKDIESLQFHMPDAPQPEHLEKEIENIRSYVGKKPEPYGISPTTPTGELNVDLDIDNKKFPVSRASMLQRRIKIIDDD